MAERPTDMSIEQLKQRYQAYAQSLSQGEDPTIDACTVREEVQNACMDYPANASSVYVLTEGLRCILQRLLSRRRSFISPEAVDVLNELCRDAIEVFSKGDNAIQRALLTSVVLLAEWRTHAHEFASLYTLRAFDRTALPEQLCPSRRDIVPDRVPFRIRNRDFAHMWENFITDTALEEMKNRSAASPTSTGPYQLSHHYFVNVNTIVHYGATDALLDLTTRDCTVWEVSLVYQVLGSIASKLKVDCSSQLAAEVSARAANYVTLMPEKGFPSCSRIDFERLFQGLDGVLDSAEDMFPIIVALSCKAMGSEVVQVRIAALSALNSLLLRTSEDQAQVKIICRLLKDNDWINRTYREGMHVQVLMNSVPIVEQMCRFKTLREGDLSIISRYTLLSSDTSLVREGSLLFQRILQPGQADFPLLQELDKSLCEINASDVSESILELLHAMAVAFCLHDLEMRELGDPPEHAGIRHMLRWSFERENVSTAQHEMIIHGMKRLAEESHTSSLAAIREWLVPRCFEGLTHGNGHEASVCAQILSALRVRSNKLSTHKHALKISQTASLAVSKFFNSIRKGESASLILTKPTNQLSYLLSVLFTACRDLSVNAASADHNSQTDERGNDDVSTKISSILDNVWGSVLQCSEQDLKEAFFSCAERLLMQPEMWEFYGRKLFQRLCDNVPTPSFGVKCYDCFARGMAISNRFSGTFLVLEEKTGRGLDIVLNKLSSEAIPGVEKLSDVAWTSNLDPVVEKAVHFLCLLMLYQPIPKQQRELLPRIGVVSSSRQVPQFEEWSGEEALFRRKQFINKCCDAITSAFESYARNTIDQDEKRTALRGMRLLRTYFSLLMSSCFVMPDALVGHNAIVSPNTIKIRLSYVGFQSEPSARDFPSAIMLSQHHTVGMLRRAIADRVQTDHRLRLVQAGHPLVDNRVSLRDARVENDTLINVVLFTSISNDTEKRLGAQRSSADLEGGAWWPDFSNACTRTYRDASGTDLYPDHMFISAAEALQAPTNRVYVSLLALADSDEPLLKEAAWETLQSLPTSANLMGQVSTLWLSTHGWSMSNDNMGTAGPILFAFAIAQTQYTLQILLAHAEDHAINFDSYTKCQRSAPTGAAWCKIFCLAGGWSSLADLLESIAPISERCDQVSADRASILSLTLRLMGALIRAHGEDVSFLANSDNSVDLLLWTLLDKLLHTPKLIAGAHGTAVADSLYREVVSNAWFLLQEMYCRRTPAHQEHVPEAFVANVVWHSLRDPAQEGEPSSSAALEAILFASLAREKLEILNALIEACLGYLTLSEADLRSNSLEQGRRAAKIFDILGVGLSRAYGKLCVDAERLGMGMEKAMFIGFTAAACAAANAFVRLDSSLADLPRELALGKHIFDSMLSLTRTRISGRVVCIEALLGFLSYSLIHFPCCETHPSTQKDVLLISISNLFRKCVELAPHSKIILAQGFMLQPDVYTRLVELFRREPRRVTANKRSRGSVSTQISAEVLDAEYLGYLTTHVLHLHYCPEVGTSHTDPDTTRRRRADQQQFALKQLSATDLIELLERLGADKVQFTSMNASLLRKIFQDCADSSVVEAIISHRLFVQLTGDAPLNIARTRDCRETLLSILEVICQDCASASLIVIELLRTQLQYDVVLACNAAAPAYLVQEDDASPVIHDDASLRHKPSHGFVGLVNMGNTCYMNSILQQLNALAPFREAMLDDASDVNGNLAAAYQHKVLTEMKSTFRALNALLLNAHDPRSLIKAFSDVLPIQNVYQQQDADEFLGALLDHIEEAMKYVPSCILDENTPKHSIIRDLFVCDWTYVSKCENCGQMWESVERRYKIDLDIKNHSDIVGGLAALMTPEEIHDFRCEHCSTVANITRSGYFRNLPPVLILHLKRFDFDMQTFTRRKIYQFCAFPFDKMLTLQVKPESVTSASVEYELTGVVVHSGSADHGHYYSFLKCPMHPGSIGVKDRAWLKFDDRCVTEFDISRAEVEWFGGRDDSSQHERRYSAYILLYTRRDQIEKICRRSHTALFEKALRDVNHSFLRDVMALSGSLVDFVRNLLEHIQRHVQDLYSSHHDSTLAKWKLALVSISRLLSTFVLCTRARVAAQPALVQQLVDILRRCLPSPPDTTDLPREWQECPQTLLAPATLPSKRARIEIDARAHTVCELSAHAGDSTQVKRVAEAGAECSSSYPTFPLFFAFMPLHMYECADGTVVYDSGIGYDVMDTKRWLVDQLSSNPKWLKMVTSYSQTWLLQSGFGRTVAFESIILLFNHILDLLMQEEEFWQCQAFTDLNHATDDTHTHDASTYIRGPDPNDDTVWIPCLGTIWPCFRLSSFVKGDTRACVLDDLAKRTAPTLHLLSSIRLPCLRGEISSSSPTIRSSNPLLRFVVALCDLVADELPAHSPLDHSTTMSIARQDSDGFGKTEVIVLDDADGGDIHPYLFDGYREERARQELLASAPENAHMPLCLLQRVAEKGTQLARVVMIRASLISKLTALILLSTQQMRSLARSELPATERIERLQQMIKAAWALLVTLLRSTCTCVRELSAEERASQRAVCARLHTAMECSWVAITQANALIEDENAADDDLYESEEPVENVFLMPTLSVEEVNQLLSPPFLREIVETDRDLLSLAAIKKAFCCVLDNQYELWKTTTKSFLALCVEVASIAKIARRCASFNRSANLLRFLCSTEQFREEHLCEDERVKVVVEELVSQLVCSLDSVVHTPSARTHARGLLVVMHELVSKPKDPKIRMPFCRLIFQQLPKFLRKVFLTNCELSKSMVEVLRHVDLTLHRSQAVQRQSSENLVNSRSLSKRTRPVDSYEGGRKKFAFDIDADSPVPAESLYLAPHSNKDGADADIASSNDDGDPNTRGDVPTRTCEANTVYELVFEIACESINMPNTVKVNSMEWIDNKLENGDDRIEALKWDSHVCAEKGADGVCMTCVYNCWTHLIFGRPIEAELFSPLHKQFLVKLRARNSLDERKQSENPQTTGDYLKGEMVNVYSALIKKHKTLLREFLDMPVLTIHKICDLIVYFLPQDPRGPQFHNEYTSVYYRFLQTLATADHKLMIHLGSSYHVAWATEQFLSTDRVKDYIEVSNAICDLGSSLTSIPTYRQKVLDLFCDPKRDLAARSMPVLRLLKCCFAAMNEDYPEFIRKQGMSRLSENVCLAIEQLSTIDPPDDLEVLSALLECTVQVIRWIVTSDIEDVVKECTENRMWPQQPRVAQAVAQCMLWLATLETQRAQETDMQDSEDVNVERLCDHTQELLREVLHFLQDEPECLKQVLKYVQTCEWTPADPSDANCICTRQVCDRALLVVKTLCSQWLSVEENLLQQDTCCAVANIGWRTLAVLVAKNYQTVFEFHRHYTLPNWGERAVEELSALGSGSLPLGCTRSHSAIPLKPMQEQLLRAEEETCRLFLQMRSRFDESLGVWDTVTRCPSCLGAVLTVLKAFLLYPVLFSRDVHVSLEVDGWRPVPEITVWPKHVLNLLCSMPPTLLLLGGSDRVAVASKIRACARAGVAYMKTVVQLLASRLDKSVGVMSNTKPPVEKHTLQVQAVWRVVSPVVCSDEICQEVLRACKVSLDASLAAYNEADTTKRPLRDIASQLREMCDKSTASSSGSQNASVI